MTPTAEFINVLRDVERRPYFELSISEKAALRRMEKTFGSKIEAWSFIPHPDVLPAIQKGSHRLVRYIFTVDTLMAKAYFAVKEFLSAQKVNINSYFSGGWADFVCEAHLTDKQFETLLGKLTAILVETGVDKLIKGEKVRQLISVFRVKEPLIICGQEISKIAAPNREILDEIRDDPVKFEVVYRNYQAADAKNYFEKGEKELRSFVKRLQAAHAIICFSVVFDRSRHIEWDYVPLQRVRRRVHLDEQAMQDPKLLKPIVDLLEVDPIDTADEEEAEVSHIFINQYDFPGERQDWKRLLYATLGENANLYTYPLEGTLNESPIYLSDVPETLERANRYQAGSLLIGQLEHPLIKSPPKVSLGIQALSNHGVTFGMPGSGKTNTDVLLIQQIVPLVSNVIVLDASGSVKGKLGVMNTEVKQKLQSTRIEHGAEPDSIAKTIDELISNPGFHLVEPDSPVLPAVFDALIKKIETIDDATTANQARTLKGVLLVEEANDAFGADPDRVNRLKNLEMLLNKASRKGWGIWLSTQYPVHLGSDDDSRLRLLQCLKNRIIHNMGADEQTGLIVKALEAAGFTLEDRQYTEQTLKVMAKSTNKGSALLFGTESNDEGKFLSPLQVNIQKLPMHS